MPDSPLTNLSHVSAAPRPSGVTAPTPVTTTRRLSFLPFIFLANPGFLMPQATSGRSDTETGDANPRDMLRQPIIVRPATPLATRGP